jgi:glycosyltransferase involved in cell wall biosynthesis
MWASRLTGIPYVSHVRDFARGWFQPGNLEALNRAARVVANSQATARACISAGVRAAGVVTIYNPVDTAQQLQSSKSAMRSELGIPSDAFVVGLVGQVQPIKGHAEFVTAALQIAAQAPDAHFLMVGAAPPDPEAQQFAQELHVTINASHYADRFHMLGFRNDVSQLLAAMDVLCVPSWNEPFGRVAVEGMAAGLAVLGTSAGGLPEIITGEVDGLLVPPRDTAALEAALLRLRCEPDLRTKLGERAASSAQRFGVDQHIRAIENMYDTVLTNRSRAA